MSVSFNSAVSAYNNAAKIASSSGESSSASSSSATSGGGFSGMINDSISNTVSSLRTAENTISKSLVKQADITDVVTAITNAQITLKTVMEVRDRLLAAHQEIMRMPI